MTQFIGGQILFKYRMFHLRYFISVCQTFKMNNSSDNDTTTTDIEDLAMNILLGINMSSIQWEQLWNMAHQRMNQSRDKEASNTKNENEHINMPPTPPTSSASNETEEESEDEGPPPLVTPPPPPPRRVSFPDDLPELVETDVSESSSSESEETAVFDDIMWNNNGNNNLGVEYLMERDRLWIDRGNLYGLAPHPILDIYGSGSISDGHVSVFASSSSSESSEDNWDVSDLSDLLNI